MDCFENATFPLIEECLHTVIKALELVLGVPYPQALREKPIPVETESLQITAGRRHIGQTCFKYFLRFGEDPKVREFFVYIDGELGSYRVHSIVRCFHIDWESVRQSSQIVWPFGFVFQREYDNKV